MVTRSVKNADELALLKVYLDNRKKPFTVEITEGRDRSGEQNRLAFKWYAEISQQTGEDKEDVRARCKLEIGVPILRNAHEKFRETYDRLIKDWAYEDKLELIRDTEMPVTRLMNVTQMSEYMDIMFRRHAAAGVELTVPPDRYAFNPERMAA